MSPASAAIPAVVGDFAEGEQESVLSIIPGEIPPETQMSISGIACCQIEEKRANSV